MDEGAYHWLLKTARKNFWRVCSWYEFEDLVQDGHLHYYRIVQKYQNVSEPRHRMALFKITYINHIHDLAKARTRTPEILAEDLGIEKVWDVLNDLKQDLPATETFLNAPPYLKQLLIALAKDKAVKALAVPFRRHRNKLRETLNDRLCHIAGLDPKAYDLPGELRVYFSAV